MLCGYQLREEGSAGRVKWEIECFSMQTFFFLTSWDSISLLAQVGQPGTCVLPVSAFPVGNFRHAPLCLTSLRLMLNCTCRKSRYAEEWLGHLLTVFDCGSMGLDLENTVTYPWSLIFIHCINSNGVKSKAQVAQECFWEWRVIGEWLTSHCITLLSSGMWHGLVTVNWEFECVACRTRPSLRGSFRGKESTQQWVPVIRSALGLKQEGCHLEHT